MESRNDVISPLRNQSSHRFTERVLISTQEGPTLGWQLRAQLLRNPDSLLSKAIRLPDIQRNHAAQLHNRIIAGSICVARNSTISFQLLNPAVTNDHGTIIGLGLQEIEITTDTPCERCHAGHMQASDKVASRRSISRLL